MQYDEFLKTMGQHGGSNEREHVDQASKIVLATIGQRLSGREPKDLASQLPGELQEPLLQHTGADETGDDLDDFLRQVVDREGRGSAARSRP